MADPANLAPEMDNIDWRDWIDHREAVSSDDTLETAHRRFLSTDVGFMAVLEGRGPVGLCSRQAVGMKLGTQYGYSLFGKAKVTACMVPDPPSIRVGQSCSEVLIRVFSRSGDSFHEDVPLVDGAGDFLGLISIQSLTRLQNRLFLQHIGQLEEKRAEITRRNCQMIEELLMAREMQVAMLTDQWPPVKSGASHPPSESVRLLRHYAPLGLVSGDFYEALTISETAVGLFIADVMGHGMQAALVTAMVRALIHSHSHLAADPGRFLAALNRDLCEIFSNHQTPIFISAFAVVADLAGGTLRYANAGHPSPILLRRTEGSVCPLECRESVNGGVLGVAAGARFGSQQSPLGEGDVLLMFTDGLFEVEARPGFILGMEGLLALAAAHIGETGEVLVRKLVESVRQSSRSGKFEDDVCLVGLEALVIGGNSHLGVERLP